ncbi:MAG: hypothetical protein EOP51_04165 [Sphingobacteriales bacterium]|nr:MAG: hypothetical protein EOP51_04165 [Sphingobacteriales bacterium]
MNDKLYINNKTNKPMHATISDGYTGSSILECELKPGSNEIAVRDLDTGVYRISLIDHNNSVIYEQKLIRD